MLMIDLQFFAEKNISKQRSASLKKGIRSYKEVIALHKDKIANPEKYFPGWDEIDPREQAGTLRHWQKEIKNAKQSMDDRIAELRRRGEYDE